MKKILTIAILNLGIIFSQSIITIGGTGTLSTSAHVTVTTNGYKCPGEFIVEGGASLTTWDPSAICSASTSGGGDVSLPVELTDFSAEQVGSAILVKWNTASEENNIGFVLDRKTDDTEWVCITDYKSNNDLLGQGTCPYSSDYEYTDNFIMANTTYYYRLADVSADGVVQYHDKITVTTDALQQTSKPNDFTLYPAYPNPFNPVTSIRFDIPEASNVKITVYNELGKVVKVLVDNNLSAGHHVTQWDSKDSFGESVSAGIYLYKIESGGYQKTMKMVLVK